MAIRSIGQNPDVGMQSNWVTVNGSTMRANALKSPSSEKLTVSADELTSVLVLGRRTILQGIEEFYQGQVEKNPNATIVRPSIWTAQLGTTPQTSGRNSKVFTEKGYDNGGIITSPDELQPAFHGHWDAVREAGFLPEVRRSSGKPNDGSWLLLRKPTLPEVLHHWFGHETGTLRTVTETILDQGEEAMRQNLRRYRILGERAVDQMPDAERSREQIALILSMAAIKFALGDRQGHDIEVDDALWYADNDSRMDMSTIRAIENSTFEIMDSEVDETEDIDKT